MYRVLKHGDGRRAKKRENCQLFDDLRSGCVNALTSKLQFLFCYCGSAGVAVFQNTVRH